MSRIPQWYLPVPTAKQPAPKKGDVVVLDAIMPILDTCCAELVPWLVARQEHGAKPENYGTMLMSGNGREVLRDWLEEALDGVMYAGQWHVEQGYDDASLEMLEMATDYAVRIYFLKHARDFPQPQLVVAAVEVEEEEEVVQVFAPCFKCGNQPFIEGDDLGDDSGYLVCACGMWTGEGMGLTEAIAWWNDQPYIIALRRRAAAAEAQNATLRQAMGLGTAAPTPPADLWDAMPWAKWVTIEPVRSRAEGSLWEYFRWHFTEFEPVRDTDWWHHPQGKWEIYGNVVIPLGIDPRMIKQQRPAEKGSGDNG